MEVVQRIVFVVVLITAGYFLRKRILRLRDNVRIGKKKVIDDQIATRAKNVLLVAFGQKKMFKRVTPAFFHFLIYAGFLIINLEVLEFTVDGIAGTHRIFSPFLGAAYPVLINIFEFLGVSVLVSCVVFLVRRNVFRLPRFWSAEMTSWPRLDANLILCIEIVLMCAILTMNATDQILQTRLTHYAATGKLFFSSFLMPVFSGLSTPALETVERFAWWFHIFGILFFMIYVTYSKHLHIFMAFPNTWYATLGRKGHMQNMPAVTKEVRSMLGMTPTVTPGDEEPARFGAKDIGDLNWNTLLSAYSCTECGRCTSECPANITGKKLSPRKIMMDTRDRMEEVGRNIASGKLDDGKTLLNDYITKEEINACTSCNACVEACPVLINPLEIILELRRYVAMEESGAPAQWNSVFQNIETNFAPWKFSPGDRFRWADDLTHKS